MTTLYFHHDAYLRHQGPPGHPERPDRLRALEAILGETRFDGLKRREAPLGENEAILRAHPERLLDLIRGAEPETGTATVDPDTYVSRGSVEAALRGVGAAVGAVDAVLDGEADNAFSASRPPGHHAERDRAMGFCLFNNVAIAALHARHARGLERVAIVDFDVHHGNGSQDIFWNNGSVLYTSTHQMPLYPGTGAKSETGEKGTIVNAPLSPGDGSEAFRTAMDGVVLPAVDNFAPDLILISAGFDAHFRDPLAQIALQEDDFAWATARLMALAEQRCSGRVVSVLEGGYDLTGLARSAAVHIRTLMNG